VFSPTSTGAKRWRWLLTAGLALGLVGGQLVGVAAPALANNPSQELRSYMLTSPSGVIDDTGMTEAERRAWRDLVRNYSTNPSNPSSTAYNPVYPMSRPAQMGRAGGTLFAGLELISLVDSAETGPQWMSYQDPWSREDPRPDHIDPEEWNMCARSSSLFGDVFNGLRDWQREIETNRDGGANCPAIRANWGAPLSDDHQPVGTDQMGGFPVSATAGPLGVTVGAPTFNSDPAMQSPSVWGWLYPIHLQGDHAGAATAWIRLESRYMRPDGSFLTTTSTPNIWSTRGTPPAEPSNSGQQLLPGHYCGGGWACFNAGWNRSATAIGNEIANGAMPIGSSVTIQYNPGTSPVVATKPLPLSVPYTSIKIGTKPPAPELEPVELVTTVTDDQGRTYTCRTTVFTENPGSVAPLPCNPDFPDEIVETKRIVEIVPQSEPDYVPGSDPGRKVVEVEPTPEWKEWRERYPECASSRCLLDLRSLDKDGASCFDLVDECLGWSVDPNRETKYQCVYGTHVLALNECRVYAPTFSKPMRDAGYAYDPKAGDNPGESTSVPPNTGPLNTPVQNPTDKRECFPSGWGVFNPVEWVMRPVICALQWAFVPRQAAVQNAQNTIQIAWRGSALGQMATQAELLGGMFQAQNGCAGLPFEIDAFGIDFHGRLFESCSEPWAGVAATVRNLLIGVICVGAFLAVIRYGAAVFGFIGLGMGMGDHETNKAGTGVSFK
jgi:hypothetical protein